MPCEHPAGNWKPQNSVPQSLQNRQDGYIHESVSYDSGHGGRKEEETEGNGEEREKCGVGMGKGR